EPSSHGCPQHATRYAETCRPEKALPAPAEKEKETAMKHPSRARTCGLLTSPLDSAPLPPRHAASCARRRARRCGRGPSGARAWAAHQRSSKGFGYIGLKDGVGLLRLAGCGQPACGPRRLDVAPGAQALADSSPTVAGRLVYAGRNTGEVLAWPAG